MSNSLKIERLEAEITTLKEQNTLLESQAQKLKEELNFTINYSQDTKKSIFKIRELEETNFDLKISIARKESEFKLEKRSLEAKYEIEINKLKSEIQLINHKYDTMMRYDLYIKKIEEANRELTQQINDLEEKHTSGIQAEEKKFEIKFGLLQQKTLAILGESKKNIQANAMQNMNNSFKLVNLQVNELHHQLSEQSAMLEELLKQLNKKEKLNQSLKISISVYKEVEKIIVTQNRRLSKMIKRMLESKRIEGETKLYMFESKKFLNILKNEETSETEDSFEENNKENECYFNGGSVSKNNNEVKFNSNFEIDYSKSRLNNFNNINGNDENGNNNDYNSKSYNNDYNSKSNGNYNGNKINHENNNNNNNFYKKKNLLNGFIHSNANPNSLINKELTRIKLVKIKNMPGLLDSPAKPRKSKDSAEKQNLGYNSDHFHERPNKNLFNIDNNTIISNNLTNTINNRNHTNNLNNNINNFSSISKSNSKSISNDNIFAKFLRKTFNNFSASTTAEKSNNNVNPNNLKNAEAKKTNIQNYYQNLYDSKDLTAKNSNNKNKNLSNFANSSINSTILISNNFNIAEKNNSNLLASKLIVKEESGSMEASAAKGHFEAFKGKNYNNSSLLDEMNSTMEFGNTFVKNFSFNNFSNLKKSVINRENDNLGFSEVIEAKSNNLIMHNAIGHNGKLRNSGNNYEKEKENEVAFELNSDLVINSSNKDSQINNGNNRNNVNLKDIGKKKVIFSVTSKVDKMLKNSKYARNNQILDKYEAELIKGRDNQILGLN